MAVTPRGRLLVATGLGAALVALGNALAVPTGIGAIADTACSASFYAGAAPTIPATSARRSKLLCPGPFAALTSGLTRTGLWSAERLTGRQAVAAASLVRSDSFRAEPTLAHEDRAELRDYRGSGFDRGHLTPVGDEADALSAFATYSLGQIAPQDPENNRHLWEDIEATTRRLAKRDGELWIVTGTLFRSSTLKVLAGRVYVPTHLYKAVYDPGAQAAGVYVAANAPGRAYQQVSVDAFLADTGIDPFPGLRGMARTTAGLPAIEHTRHGPKE